MSSHKTLWLHKEVVELQNQHFLVEPRPHKKIHLLLPSRMSHLWFQHKAPHLSPSVTQGEGFPGNVVLVEISVAAHPMDEEGQMVGEWVLVKEEWDRVPEEGWARGLEWVQHLGRCRVLIPVCEEMGIEARDKEEWAQDLGRGGWGMVQIEDLGLMGKEVLEWDLDLEEEWDS